LLPKPQNPVLNLSINLIICMTSQITGSVKNKIVHPDLEKERSNLNFDQEELRNYLSGGINVRL